MDTTTPTSNPPAPNVSRRFVKGIELRYLLTMELFDTGPASVRQLMSALQRRGFRMPGRMSKTISDSLRWERDRGRVRRLGHGRYGPGYMPRGTEHRISHRVEQLRAEAEQLLSLARRAPAPQRQTVTAEANGSGEALN